MTQRLEQSLIRVLNAHGTVVGAGFVVAERLAVTCAHVVETAGSGPGQSLAVRFFAGDETQAARVLPEGWAQRQGDDVAFVALDLLPEGVVPARLGTAEGREEHRYRSLGFARVANYETRRASDLIAGIVPAPGKRPMLQLKGEEIKQGMSGAPVLDVEVDRVVGMVSEFSDDDRSRIAWATTADTLATLLPGLHLESESPEQPRSARPLRGAHPPGQLRLLRLFVASPGDVRDERDRLERVVAELNQPGGMAEQAGYVLRVLGGSVAVGGMGRPQGVIISQFPPETWDIFVGILWTRFGSLTGGRDLQTGQLYNSGTEEEFRAGYRQWDRAGRPAILVYRCDRAISPSAIDLTQLDRVQAFWKEFETGGAHEGLYQQYITPDEFERRVRSGPRRLLPPLE